MKFQKTLLAVSLAVVAGSVHAAVVDQVAKPVQVTEGLYNPNYIYNDTANGIANLVQAPVHGELATIHNNTYPTQAGWHAHANDYLPEVTDVINHAGELVGYDLGSQSITGTGNAAQVKYDVFKYTGPNNQVIYRFQNPKTGEYTGFFTKNGNALQEYTGTVDLNTLQKGGQIDGATGAANLTGHENKVVNGEHVLYGYQGGTVVQAGSVNGVIVAPDGTSTEERVQGAFGKESVTATDVRYVQTGIVANTGVYNGRTENEKLDPSKNIYGVSARDNANVTMLTGNGIALADLSNKGVLHTDGSVQSNVLKEKTVGGVQKTREYSVNGKRILEIYNDDAGRVLAPRFYEITGNGADLAEYKGTAPTAGSHVKTGTAEYTDGIYDVAKVHNTVTNKNVTYKESVEVVAQQNVNAGITTPNGNTTDINKTFSANATEKSEQYVSTGVIGENADKSNKYGLEVVQSTTKAGKDEPKKYSEVTADGFKTTGYVDAADFKVNGVSITQSLKDSVDEAKDAIAGGLTEAKAYTDTKAGEAIAAAKTGDAETLAAAKAADAETLKSANAYTDAAIGGFSSSINGISKRLDDVEETAYRGTAIALAAAQQVPNIKPGQFALFGGVGHYESETAIAVGGVAALADGRTSISGALGTAGSEVGARVGVSYVFGGN